MVSCSLFFRCDNDIMVMFKIKGPCLLEIHTEMFTDKNM